MEEQFIKIVKELLNSVRETLETKYNVREELLLQTRTVIRDCGVAVSLIHKGEVDKAIEKLKDIESTLTSIGDNLSKYPELAYGDVLIAYQEYVEVLALLSIVKSDPTILTGKLKDMNIPAISIVNGLADLIGELKREALESLLKDNVEQARKYLKLMEDLYTLLYDFEYPRSLVPGLRQKIDVARKIIEDTRRIILECKIASDIKSIMG